MLSNARTFAIAGMAALLATVSACGQLPAGSTGNGLFGAAGNLSQADASRLAKQATFGPTWNLISSMTTMTAAAWVDQQLAATGSSYADLATRVVPTNQCSTLTGQEATNCNRDYLTALPVTMRFYSNAMSQPDQLRQRVAFALSQILVASDFEVKSTAGAASLNQIFLANAFGNYREVLRQTTLNGFMGDYLDMAGSSKSAPNENYARELMQLFSIGTDALNMDGTRRTDATGASIATYTATDVKEVARALTGWTQPRFGGVAITNGANIDYSQPMVVNATNYDTAAKNFLGVNVPAGATQDLSLNRVIDAVFNNTSTPPFVAKRLIQNLVTSNPSPAYVQRIAQIFVDNGAGVRGDMKAMVRAILLDAEARGVSRAGPTDGKVKEPVLLLASLGRLLNLTSDGYAFVTRDQGLGERPFSAPSVFNFFPPDYPLPLSNGLTSPSTKLMTTSTVLGRSNLLYDWTVTGDTRTEYATQTVIPGATGTQVDWTVWSNFGTDTEGLINRIDLVMLNNTMTTAQRNALRVAMLAITNADPATQARKRAQVALYIVGSSPQFQVDR